VSATINFGKNHYNSRCHFPSAPEMTPSTFIRHIIFATSGMLYIVVVYVYALSSITSSGLLPWTSISQTRSQASQVEAVPSHTQLGVQSKFIWWFIPVWSLILFSLAVLGEENKRGYRTTFTWLSQRLKGDLLPVHMKSSSKTATVPAHLLRSGWDDDLDLRSPVGSLRSKRFSFLKKTESTRASTPSPTPPDDEFVFAQFTHAYLASSTPQQQRLPSPPPAVRLHNHSPFASAPKQSQGGISPSPTTAMDVDPIVPASPNSHVFPEDTWPEPPVTLSSVSPQSSAVIVDPRPPSPLSTRSSIGSTIVDALGAIPTHLRDAPFYVNGPSVTALPTVQGIRGPTQHRPSVRRGQKRNEAIYMTVVHETIDGP